MGNNVQTIDWSVTKFFLLCYNTSGQLLLSLFQVGISNESINAFYIFRIQEMQSIKYVSTKYLSITKTLFQVTHTLTDCPRSFKV